MSIKISLFVSLLLPTAVMAAVLPAANSSMSSADVCEQVIHVLLDEICELKQQLSTDPSTNSTNSTNSTDTSTTCPPPTTCPPTTPCVTDTPVSCPENFSYVSSVNGCYKVVLENLNWTTASRRCKALNIDAHLVIIDNAAEQSAIMNLINVSATIIRNASCQYDASQSGNGFVLYTAGQRIDPSSSSPFLYRILSADGNSESIREMTYKNFGSGEPNYGGTGGPAESCVDIRSSAANTWNDVACTGQYCSICEIDMQV
jgi:hypothetical protein